MILLDEGKNEMARELVIGLDLGTTSVKACIFDMNGNLVAEAEQMVKTSYPMPGRSEQDAVAIERSSVQAVADAVAAANALPHELVVVGFSAAMHSILMINESGQPISPALIWADGRSSAQVKALADEEKQSIYASTGTPVHPMTPLTKFMWMKEQGYEPYLNAAYFMSIKEYIIYQWFGERVIDYAMASATGLFDAKHLKWEQSLLDRVGIKEEQLSTLVAPTYRLRHLNSDIAEQMGIPANLPFCIGSADGQLANLGSGAIQPGEAAVSVGTSGAIRQFTHTYNVSDKQETFCYSFAADSYIIGGPTNNGGVVLQWIKDMLKFEGSFPEFISLAEQVEPGAEGLIFLPYINGERAPLWNQQAKGNFFGLSITHKQEHMVRAVLEGITLNLYQIGSALTEVAGAPERIYVNGGLARSPIWLQMMADIFGADIYVTETHNSAAWGAAWTALVGIEKVESFAAIKENIPMSAPVHPNAENSAKYRDIYNRYAEVANTVKVLF